MGRGSAYTFLKRRHTNGQRYMKRCSASLSSGKCKSKLTSVRMDVLKKTRDEFGWGCRGKGATVCCWWECKLVYPLWKTIWQLLKNLKIVLQSDPVSEGNRNTRRKTQAPSWSFAALFTIVKARKQTKCSSMDEWIKENVGTSLVVQWLTVFLAMQGTRVRSLVWADSICHRATKPMHHIYWAHGLEPVLLTRETTATRSPRTTTKSSPHSATRESQNK